MVIACELNGVSIWTPEKKRILDNVDWQVERGQHWVVLGPNGAGKTTMLSVVGAERHPSEGTATILGERLGKTDMRELRRRIGRVDPTLRMLDWVTGEEAVLTGLKNTIWPQWNDWDENDYARAREMLSLVGLGDFAKREVKTLSNGERQRVRIARSLIQEPEMLLLDEPATGLDFPAREALLASVDALAEEHPDLPTVMVSHHLEDLPTSVSHALLMRDGKVLASGEVGEMLTSELVSECFGFPIDVHEFGGRYAARAAAGWTVQERITASR
ncbi:MAG TPA: ATP-binding cassette domain-containing protein [Thermomicrobiales bacterium]|nr:ATP-binding cassette domain-containing protein [Thermomicrobiales bacterium]